MHPVLLVTLTNLALSALDLASFHELEALGIHHGRSILHRKNKSLVAQKSPYLDRLDVLLVVDCHTCWVQLKAGTELVRYVGTNSLIPTIAEPHLKQALLGAK